MPGILFPAFLLLSLLLSALLTVDRRYGSLEAQTPATNSQAPATDSQAPPADSLPNGHGKDIVLRECVKCHSLKTVTNKHASDEEWAKSVNEMVNRGAALSDDEIDQVIDYLSKNFKPLDSDQKPQPDTKPQSDTAPQH